MIGLGLGLTFQAGRGGGGGAWTPADLTDTWDAWFDAQDASTLTISGGLVSEWLDKSGSGNHITQGTPSDQPEYVADGLNGLPALRNASNDRLLASGSANVLRNVPGGTIIAVMLPPSGVSYGGNGSPVFVSSGSSGSSTRFSLNWRPGNATFLGMGIRRLDSDAFQSVASSTSTASVEGVPIIEIGMMNWETATANHWTNGVRDLTNQSVSLSTGLTSNTNPVTFSLFSGGPGIVVSPQNTFIAEVLIARRVLTDVERGLVEGYLSEKWAIDLA